MLCFIAVAILSCLALEPAQADDTYAYKYQVTQFYASLLSNVAKSTEKKIEEVSRMMQDNCKFTSAVQEYEDILSKAKALGTRLNCITTDHEEALNSIKATFNSTREQCLKQVDCANNVAANTETAIKSIQAIDADNEKQVAGCSDEACKLKVYKGTNDALTKLYQENMPALRLAVDQAVANTKCVSGLVDCMVSKNSDNLKLAYSGSAHLATCIANSPRFYRV